MIGANLPHHIQSDDDARAYAAAIAALRAEIDANTKAWEDEMSPLDNELKDMRAARNAENEPLTKRADELRKVLADWLAGDPDGNLRDGDRIVATLARKAGKPVIDAAKLPDEYKTLAPDLGKINAALARGEKVQGVVVKVETSLRVL